MFSFPKNAVFMPWIASYFRFVRSADKVLFSGLIYSLKCVLKSIWCISPRPSNPPTSFETHHNMLNMLINRSLIWHFWAFGVSVWTCFFSIIPAKTEFQIIHSRFAASFLNTNLRKGENQFWTKYWLPKNFSVDRWIEFSED